MSYSSGRGRPMENASKIAHSHVIADPDVRDFLSKCMLPKGAGSVHLDTASVVCVEPMVRNPIRHVIAFDGGYQEIPVKKEYPSASIGFFQFGALFFEMQDLLDLGSEPFIAPEDMAKLNQIERFKVSIPIRNVKLADAPTLTDSIRRTLYRFCESKPSGGTSFNVTLAWLIFRTYAGQAVTWDLARCPACGRERIQLTSEHMSDQHTYVCPHCSGTIYLTDVFRLQELIDDDFGAGGIFGYLTNTLEQLALAHIIRLILDTKPAMLEEILLVRDGPLAFFGQTANLHHPFRDLTDFLLTHRNLYLVGLEKSGPFVDHAHAISSLLLPGQALVLSSDYIYANILPRSSAASGPYGSSTYYGTKVIYKSLSSGMYVATVPSPQSPTSSQQSPIPNLNIILNNLNVLKCDMYDSALLPIALANHLVSLANHPSAVLLEKFARQSVVH
jgi:hypothetical protein